jgi:hypothetical protein
MSQGNSYFPPPTNNIPHPGAKNSPRAGDQPLTRKQIIKAVEEALKNELKRIAVDANMYQLYGFKSSHSVRCYEKKRAIRAFLELLPTIYDPKGKD